MKEDGLKLNLNLSPALTRSIENELADHIACANEKAEAKPYSKESPAIAGTIRERLSLASTLRKLTAPHVVDQVSHTLWRKPTRAEWREFGWLLFWFILVYASDLIAASRNFEWQYTEGIGIYTYTNELAKTVQNHNLMNETIFAWILSAVARAGFFVQFGLTFVRAYRSGIGVMVARLIQLKLLHTILVTIGFAVLPQNYSEEALLWQWNGGAVVNSWVILIAMVMTALALAFAQVLFHREKPERTLKPKSGVPLHTAITYLWFLLLLFVFLFQGAPAHISSVKYDFTSRNPNTDRSKVFTCYYTQTSGPLYTSLNLSNHSLDKTFERLSTRRNIRSFEVVDKWWSMPFTKAGAGLGWLAFPIPLMGILSLLAMWWILGRRSVWDALLYGAIVFYAFWGTIGPFLLGSNVPLSPAHEFLSGSPTPCFDAVFQAGLFPGTYHSFDNFLRVVREEYISITFAFFFSALIPWLMVGLFARTKVGKKENSSVAAE